MNSQLSLKMENQVRSTLKKATDAWEEGNARAFTNLFTEDATYTVWYGTQLKGKAEIEQGHEFVFTVLYPNSRLHLDIVEIRMLGEDVALVHSEASLLMQEEKVDEPEAVPLWIMHRINGEWKIAVMQNTLYAVKEFQQIGDVKYVKKLAGEIMRKHNNLPEEVPVQ